MALPSSRVAREWAIEPDNVRSALARENGHPAYATETSGWPFEVTKLLRREAPGARAKPKRKGKEKKDDDDDEDVVASIDWRTGCFLYQNGQKVKVGEFLNEVVVNDRER